MRHSPRLSWGRAERGRSPTWSPTGRRLGSGTARPAPRHRHRPRKPRVQSELSTTRRRRITGTRILSTARADVDGAAAAPEGGAPRGDTAHGAASVGGRGDHDGGAGSGPPRVSSPGPRGGCPQSHSMKSACWGLIVPRLSKRLFLKQAKDWSPSDTFPECLPKRRRHSAVLLSNHIINFWTQINFFKLERSTVEVLWRILWKCDSPLPLRSQDTGPVQGSE